MFGRKLPAPPPAPEDCLPGRDQQMPVPEAHAVNGHPLQGPWPERPRTPSSSAWAASGAPSACSGSCPACTARPPATQGGTTPNPTYEETCTARTGHTEAVLVVFDPAIVALDELFKVFWENHDPTQYMGQGNDVGSQYRSAIYTNSPEQAAAADASRDAYQTKLSESGFGQITTEIAPVGPFYYAEDYHQQYLAKNPGGYCNHGFCQVAYA
jgi:peptide-methionine (S)-S-oxide reductase